MNRPNIVMIMVDQWRADCIGFLGNSFIETPNIDNLFADSTAFTHAYSAVPSCIAARAALLTGLNQKNHGRVGYQDRVRWNYPTTLPQELSNAGYHTHCVGKMHVFPSRNLLGFNSIDLHDGYLHQERYRNSDITLVDDYIPFLRNKYGFNADITDTGVGCNGYSVNPWPLEERYHPTNWVTGKSVDFLRRRDPGKPFFLKVSYHRPHPPLDPPASYLNRYLQKKLPNIVLGDWSQKHPLPKRSADCPVPGESSQIDLARRAYFAQLTHIDNQINRIVHALMEHQVFANTLLLFVSDHGEMLYDHNFIAKALPYDASARIPLLIRLPDSCKEKVVTKVKQPVELRDIMPTLLEAAGISIPKNLDGKSLLPLCRGEEKPLREYIHGEHSRGEFSNHWLNNGKELYVWYSQTGEEQLFDLEKDPQNTHNIAGEKNEAVLHWRNKLIAELQDREEGYVVKGQLVVGRTPQMILSHLESTEMNKN